MTGDLKFSVFFNLASVIIASKKTSSTSFVTVKLRIFEWGNSSRDLQSENIDQYA